MPLPPNTLAELRRDLAQLRLINDQIAEIQAALLERLRQQPDQARHPMILLLARVIGIGIETADMLVQEVLWKRVTTGEMPQGVLLRPEIPAVVWPSTGYRARLSAPSTTCCRLAHDDPKRR